MTTSITQGKGIKSGLCPHGLPLGACPICSGKMGGGGKIRNTTVIKKSNEWSYMKCYAVWMSMKSQKASVENQKQALKRQNEFAEKLAKEINNLRERILNLAEKIKNIELKIIKIPLQILYSIILKPFSIVLSTINLLIEKIIQAKENIQALIRDLAEKITALKGELKNILFKNFTDRIKQKAKKIFLFFINIIKDENYKNDDTLSVFKSRELRKLLVKILKRNKK